MNERTFIKAGDSETKGWGSKPRLICFGSLRGHRKGDLGDRSGGGLPLPIAPLISGLRCIPMGEMGGGGKQGLAHPVTFVLRSF